MSYYEVQLHGHVILEVHKDGYVIDSCGWRSVTTKERLNRYIPHHTVYQRDWVWYIRDHNDGWEDNPEFIDGMFICNDGAMYKSITEWKACADWYELDDLGESEFTIINNTRVW